MSTADVQASRIDASPDIELGSMPIPSEREQDTDLSSFAETRPASGLLRTRFRSWTMWTDLTLNL